MKHLINKIHHADCLEFMKQLPDKCIDLVLADPPYGIGYAYESNNSKNKLSVAQDYGKYDWNDSIPEPVVFEEIFRVSKNQIIWGGNYFVESLKNSRCWLVWNKVNGKSDYADCELAFTSFDKSVRIIDYIWNGMMQGKSIDEGFIQQGNKKLNEVRIHPMQKPLALIQWCVFKYSKPVQLILDPYSGSATTAVACHKLNRRFICVEKEKKYVDSSRRRLKEEQAQGNLF